MSQIMFNKIETKTNMIEFILVNWVNRNLDIYLEDFKYYKEDSILRFVSYIGPEKWEFKLKLPIDKSDIFFLSAENNNPSEFQMNVINEINIKAFEYDYNDLIEYNNFTSVINSKFNETILAKILIKINDACCDYDADVSDDVEETTTEEYIPVNHKLSELLYDDVLDENLTISVNRQFEKDREKFREKLRENDIWKHDEEDEYENLRRELLDQDIDINDI